MVITMQSYDKKGYVCKLKHCLVCMPGSLIRRINIRLSFGTCWRSIMISGSTVARTAHAICRTDVALRQRRIIITVGRIRRVIAFRSAGVIIALWSQFSLSQNWRSSLSAWGARRSLSGTFWPWARASGCCAIRRVWARDPWHLQMHKKAEWNEWETSMSTTTIGQRDRQI